jgi:hypothetical protein
MNKDLPLYEIIEKGIKKLNTSSRPKPTLETLIVSIGAPKLISNGLPLRRTIKNPEHKLYDYLAKKFSPERAYSLYNSYIRRLVSFERALQCAKKPT